MSEKTTDLDPKAWWIYRRPLLISGKPGTGKTSLAYAVANQLGLGLYQYDAIDKSDIDLPNDLLHIFEEGTFEIPIWINKS